GKRAVSSGSGLRDIVNFNGKSWISSNLNGNGCEEIPDASAFLTMILYLFRISILQFPFVIPFYYFILFEFMKLYKKACSGDETLPAVEKANPRGENSPPRVETASKRSMQFLH